MMNHANKTGVLERIEVDNLEDKPVTRGNIFFVDIIGALAS